MKLAVIPARGGSKRIPRKNIKSFGGKPMIAWSIQAAQECGIFERIVVSTDDTEIADVARDLGADVPFLRPAELSDDHTGTSPVVAHAIEWYATRGHDPSQICCIYATAPFVRAHDIRQGVETLMQTGANFAFSVTSFAFPIQRAIRLRHDGRIEMFDPDHFQTRSQDLPEAYHDAGQFYWGTRSAWLSGMPIFSACSVPVILPRYRVQDIDTPEDWEQAEALMQAIEHRKAPK
jgi:pseudaminic acid cytidylyltransferase